MTTNNNIFLGIDSGGTNLRCAIIDASGQPIASASGESANIISVGEQKALQNLTNVIQKTLQKLPEQMAIKNATFGLGGVSTRKESERWLNLIQSSDIRTHISMEIVVTNDTLAALWEGATSLPALALVGGTGSHCLGISDSGKVARSSGMEYILSDEGGAYYIGENILRAVAKACDGRGKQTCLTHAVFEFLNITNYSSLYDYIYSVKQVKPVIAGLAPLASKCAEENDEVAIGIIMHAANELSRAAKAVAMRLDLIDRAFEVVTIGSLFDNNSLIRLTVEKSIQASFPRAKVLFTEPDAAIGAAKLARDSYNVDIWSCHEEDGTKV